MNRNKNLVLREARKLSGIYKIVVNILKLIIQKSKKYWKKSIVIGVSWEGKQPGTSIIYTHTCLSNIGIWIETEFFGKDIQSAVIDPYKTLDLLEKWVPFTAKPGSVPRILTGKEEVSLEEFRKRIKAYYDNITCIEHTIKTYGDAEKREKGDYYTPANLSQLYPLCT